MVLEIFNNESVNSIIIFKLEYKFEYKLGGFNTWKLVSDITDYKLEFRMPKIKNLDEIQHQCCKSSLFILINPNV